MSYAQPGHGPLDYCPCVYPGSSQTFRGPVAATEAPFVLCLGGSETYGRFVDRPFASLLADHLRVPVVNMGVMNAGLDLIAEDGAMRAAVGLASAVVLQLPGAHNLSNRFYTVHPRRNDRFVKASILLHTVFPEVDFTEYHFTRHMLKALHERSAERFGLVVEELRQAWTARMTQVIDRIGAPVHLLWLSPRSPDGVGDMPSLGPDPLFVTAKMLEALRSRVASTTICVMPAEDHAPGARGLFFARGEEAVARRMPGPDVHAQVAEALAARLS